MTRGMALINPPTFVLLTVIISVIFLTVITTVVFLIIITTVVFWTVIITVTFLTVFTTVVFLTVITTIIFLRVCHLHVFTREVASTVNCSWFLSTTSLVFNFGSATSDNLTVVEVVALSVGHVVLVMTRAMAGLFELSADELGRHVSIDRAGDVLGAYFDITVCPLIF